jgi:UDPglucose--hexose-1-phosphate uridylyltransferase
MSTVKKDSKAVHRRQNPLTGEWVLVSPHRSSRPWQGATESIDMKAQPSYDPGCYLCPSNQRISGDQNPAFQSTFVFTNDFAALQPVPDLSLIPADNGDEIIISEEVSGTSRVICYSPDHSKSLPEMSINDIATIVECWQDQIEELSQTYSWVQIFENKGSAMGCSQPHPHGQIWASNFIPTEVSTKDAHQKAFKEKTGKNLLVEYLKIERNERSRIVVENNDWVALVPYWAAWPFETLLTPKRHITRFNELTPTEALSLAEALQELTTRYDNLFNTSFPYSMGWHYAPFDTDARDAQHWQLHACFYPPLLRSATVKKFMVGYEMLAEPQRDLTPEQAAAILQSQRTTHYKTTSGTAA